MFDEERVFSFVSKQNLPIPLLCHLADCANLEDIQDQELEMAAKTGIVMLNLGGPKNLDQVGIFLRNLFLDHELIQLPLQSFLGPFIARMRTRKVQANYQAIGGGSPILEWTRQQAERHQRKYFPHSFTT